MIARIKRILLIIIMILYLGPWLMRIYNMTVENESIYQTLVHEMSILNRRFSGD